MNPGLGKGQGLDIAPGTFVLLWYNIARLSRLNKSRVLGRDGGPGKDAVAIATRDVQRRLLLGHVVERCRAPVFTQTPFKSSTIKRACRRIEKLIFKIVESSTVEVDMSNTGCVVAEARHAKVEGRRGKGKKKGSKLFSGAARRACAACAEATPWQPSAFQGSSPSSFLPAGPPRQRAKEWGGALFPCRSRPGLRPDLAEAALPKQKKKKICSPTRQPTHQPTHAHSAS